MACKGRSWFVKAISIVLSIILLLPVNTFAAQPETVEPLASSYLDRYTAFISALGNGKISIGFSVGGTGTMDTLGVKGITLYESSDQYDWFPVKVFYSTEYPNMMTTNTCYHYSKVEYQGTAGYYYQAQLTVYAGDSTGDDTKIFWSPVKQAT